MTRGFAFLLATLALGGCEDPRDCYLGIAHRDCIAEGAPLVQLPAPAALDQFPKDDGICQGYGLTPGTHAYAVCRRKKREVRAITERETDYGFLQNPLTPDVRIIPVDPRAAGRE